MDLNRLSCCGVREITGLSDHDDEHEAMLEFKQLREGDERFRYALFTEASREGYGENFCALIRKHRLGGVVETTGRHKNPNSGNILKAWVWTVNHAAVIRYGATPRVRKVRNG